MSKGRQDVINKSDYDEKLRRGQISHLKDGLSLLVSDMPISV